MKKLMLLFAILSFLLLTSCRGDKSSKPSIALVRNMDEQTSFEPQSINTFYKDKRAQRPPIAGTIAQGEANTDSRLYKGIEPNSTPENPNWVKQFPVPLTDALLKSGQEHYNVFCSPCHGYAGNNDGLATKAAQGTIRPANIHDKEKINYPIGKIYEAVTNGVNNWNMPGFAEHMSVEERWAVVAYVRALQLSQQAVLSDLPKNISK